MQDFLANLRSTDKEKRTSEHQQTIPARGAEEALGTRETRRQEQEFENKSIWRGPRDQATGLIKSAILRKEFVTQNAHAKIQEIWP